MADAIPSGSRFWAKCFDDEISMEYYEYDFDKYGIGTAQCSDKLLYAGTTKFKNGDCVQMAGVDGLYLKFYFESVFDNNTYYFSTARLKNLERVMTLDTQYYTFGRK